MTGIQKILARPQQENPALRLLIIFGLILLLQVPISMVDGLIAERSLSREQAVQEVMQKWGHAQNIVGPQLVIPMTRRLDDGAEVQRTLVILPETLQAHARMASKPAVEASTRYRSTRRGYNSPVASGSKPSRMSIRDTRRTGIGPAW
jgi:inner membrane protein involved in colicin E2 resistance